MEFSSVTKRYVDRCEILSHLANFGYDPINSKFLRELGALQLFLDQIDKETELCKIALKGLSNCCIDPENQRILLEDDSFNILSGCLCQTDPDILKPLLTILYFLLSSPSGKAKILTPEITKLVQLHMKSKECLAKDRQLFNLLFILNSALCNGTFSSNSEITKPDY